MNLLKQYTGKGYKRVIKNLTIACKAQNEAMKIAENAEKEAELCIRK